MDEELKNRILKFFPIDEEFKKEHPDYITITERLINLDFDAIEGMANYYLRNIDKLDAFMTDFIYAVVNKDSDVKQKLYHDALKIKEVIKLHHDLLLAYYKTHEPDGRE